MSNRAVSSHSALGRRCHTRALKNARFLQTAAPHVLPEPRTSEGFGTGIGLGVLARLHRLPNDHPDLAPYEALRSWLRPGALPTARAGSRGRLFQGTVHFVQITFQTPQGSFHISDADMGVILEYARHAALPISEYAAQYGPNRVAIAPNVIRFTVNLAGTSYTDADLQQWVRAIATGLPADIAIAVPSPAGVNCAEVGGNAGYHGLASVPYTVFGVFASGLTLQDLPDQYAMVVSHELAELVVDPNVDGSNPEVCDPCDLNCGPLHRCYFDEDDRYLGSTPALPPPFRFSYYVCAVVAPSAAASCPAGDGNCDYAPPRIINVPEKQIWIQILFGIVNDAGGIQIVGGHPVPVPPMGPELSMLTGVLIAELAKKIPGAVGQSVRAAALRAVASTAMQEAKAE